MGSGKLQLVLILRALFSLESPPALMCYKNPFANCSGSSVPKGPWICSNQSENVNLDVLVRFCCYRRPSDKRRHTWCTRARRKMALRGR